MAQGEGARWAGAGTYRISEEQLFNFSRRFLHSRRSTTHLTGKENP